MVRSGKAHRRSRKNVMKACPSHVKARQASKIREIGDALIALGYLALDEQAKALGLVRSTAWTILQANHKSSGLSATVINRMLAAPHLPPVVRAIILEYIDERVAGLYDHGKLQLRRFTARLAEQRSGAYPNESGRLTAQGEKIVRPLPLKSNALTSENFWVTAE
jgi:hypothetical protein